MWRLALLEHAEDARHDAMHDVCTALDMLHIRTETNNAGHIFRVVMDYLEKSGHAEVVMAVHRALSYSGWHQTLQEGR